MSNRDSFGQGRKPPITEMSCGNILIVKVDAFVSCIFYVWTKTLETHVSIRLKLWTLYIILF